MAKRLPISFKENDRDARILLEIISHSDKSAYVKDAVEFYMNHSQKFVSIQSAHAEIPDTEENNEILSIIS